MIRPSLRLPVTLLTVAGMLSAGSTAWAQGRGGGGGGGGGAQQDSAAADSMEIGSEIEGRLIDSDSLFGIDRGDSVGASSDNVQGFSTIGGAGTAGSGGMGAGGMGGMGGMGGLGGLGGMFGGAFNQFNQSQQQGQTRALRTRLRSAVRVAPLDPQRVEAQLQQRLSSPATAARFGGANIAIDGRSAVLTGQVDSDRDRRMAQLMMRLEPGVSQVQNQLIIDSASPSSPTDRPLTDGMQTGQSAYGGPLRGQPAYDEPNFVDRSGWNPLPPPTR